MYEKLGEADRAEAGKDSFIHMKWKSLRLYPTGDEDSKKQGCH